MPCIGMRIVCCGAGAWNDGTEFIRGGIIGRGASKCGAGISWT